MTSCGKSDFDTYAQYGYCIPTEQYYTWLIDYALAFFNVENKYQWYVDSYEKSKDFLKYTDFVFTRLSLFVISV